MTEIITKKLDEIKKQKEQLMANLNALVGAEQVLQQLISEISKESEAVEDATHND